MPLYDGQPIEYLYSTDLGDRVRLARAAHDMLLIEMSNAFGVKPSLLSGCEVGKTPWPDDTRPETRMGRSQSFLRKLCNCPYS